MIARAILRRRRRRQRPVVLVLAGLGVAILSLTPTERAMPRLVLNASASAPVGLYRVTAEPAERGALVLVRPPAERRFGVPAADLASGKMAVIEKAREFTLVPWRPVLDRHVGRSVSGVLRGETISWTIGRQRGGPSIT